jgi:hypothetical protein
VATIPLCEFLQSGHDVRFVNRALSGELLVEPATDESDSYKFAQWERELRDPDSANEAAARLEVQTRLIRLAGRLRHRRTGTRPSARLSRADQITCYIARNYHEPLTSQSIAEAIGVHPNYAMNLFRETFGTTVTTFITEHRISPPSDFWRPPTTRC